jgi:hypothetical protein
MEESMNYKLSNVIFSALEIMPVHRQISIDGTTYTKHVQLCCGCTQYVWRDKYNAYDSEDLAQMILDAGGICDEER